MANDSTVTIRLPQETLERLNRLAEQDDISRSLLVRRMLLTGIYQREALPSGG